MKKRRGREGYRTLTLRLRKEGSFTERKKYNFGLLFSSQKELSGFVSQKAGEGKKGGGEGRQFDVITTFDVVHDERKKKGKKEHALLKREGGKRMLQTLIQR